MKICHVITRLIVGGAQENTIFTVQGLLEAGHSVDVISGPETGLEGSLEQEVLGSGARLIRIKELVRPLSPVKDFVAFVRLMFLFSRNRYDIIHTHSAKAGVLGRLAAGIAAPGSLVVHTVHGLSFHPFQNGLLNFFYIRIERFAAFFTDCFICVGEVMLKRSLKAGIGREGLYSVIYSGFPLEPYKSGVAARKEVRRRLHLGEGEKVIGMIARLSPLKGHDYILRTFAGIAASMGGVKLLLVGGGSLMGSLEKWVAERGLSDRVIFTGLVEPRKIPELLSAMDIVVHTSLREGLPKAIAQAFAAGKPVVAFDIDGACELVVDSMTGFLVEPGDTATLKSRIEYLLKNPEVSYKMGSSGRVEVEKRFAVDRMVEDIANLYKRLLDEQKRDGKEDSGTDNYREVLRLP